MALLSVHLGHWRALETTWAKEFNRAYQDGSVAVVTAGSHQASRLASLISEPVAGARFFPGIPFLAKSLSGKLVSEKVSVPQSIALAYQAGYEANSAAAGARFFEDLLENGITAEMFHTQSMSLKEPDLEVEETAGRFLKYQKLRDIEFPFSPESALRNSPSEAGLYQKVMFYGFYDLNPGQRNYIKKLASSTHILWFSPVHPSHYWRKAFGRTLDFLKNLYKKEDLHRVDWDFPLSSKAQFAENLLTGKAIQENHSISLKRCGSGTAFTKAVAREIEALAIPHEQVAVVASGDMANSLRTELFCNGIPCSTDLTAKASELPWGRLVIRLVSLGDNEFHHTDIEGLLATGLVTAPSTPGPQGYSEKVSKTGARFGISSLLKTGYPFGEAIYHYFHSNPVKSLPQNYLERLLKTLQKIAPGTIADGCADQLLSIRKFSSNWEVPYLLFRKMLEKALDEPVVLAGKNKDGVRVLSMEKTRGTSFRAVILTGMEEGRFPCRTVNDPRLPLEMKKLLQMPSPDNRETEEAFLLRQVFEAAEEKLVILAANTDQKGNAVSLSPFLSRLSKNRENASGNIVNMQNIPSMPWTTLDFPSNPPFLHSSLQAQRERLLFKSEEPSLEASHCGMIGEGLFTWNRISATMLESYLRNPYKFLNDSIWKVTVPEDFPVRSEPDPLNRGILVHKCVEVTLSTGNSVDETVKRVSAEFHLPILLGSTQLADIWIAHTIRGIEELKKEINSRGWDFRGSEIRLEGSIAGYPSQGRIDLMFANRSNELILADLKTGRPRGINSGNMLKNNRLQLPFYVNLARQNGYEPVVEACYIHLEGSGKVTFEEMSNEELNSIQDRFLSLVTETVEKMKMGCFPEESEKKRLNKWR